MTESELYKKAINFYHQKGNELNAIEAFKNLLKVNPNNLDSWTHLAIMQNQIADFDGAIKSINRAIRIDPLNSWTIQQKCIILSQISRFASEGQMYFDEDTKEAHEIKSFNSKFDLYKGLDESLIKVIDLEKDNERILYNYSWKLIHNKFKLDEFKQAIELLVILKEKVPLKYSANKRERELRNIESAITKNLIGLKKFDEAIIHLKRSMKNTNDNYFVGLNLADIYSTINEPENRKKILIELLKSNEKNLIVKPGLVYLSRKFELLEKLGKPNQMEEIIRDLNLIKNQNEFTLQRKNEIKDKIKKYRQQYV